jgi:hypothetical protein
MLLWEILPTRRSKKINRERRRGGGEELNLGCEKKDLEYEEKG